MASPAPAPWPDWPGQRTPEQPAQGRPAGSAGLSGNLWKATESPFAPPAMTVCIDIILMAYLQQNAIGIIGTSGIRIAAGVIGMTRSFLFTDKYASTCRWQRPTPRPAETALRHDKRRCGDRGIAGRECATARREHGADRPFGGTGASSRFDQQQHRQTVVQRRVEITPRVSSPHEPSCKSPIVPISIC